MEKYFGVCYYPELYPKEKQEAFIREDIENMRRARFNVVRMAEFCWCLMEPREGVYDFDWLEEIVDRLGQNGIYTVLCTPTACQPVWMARRYPETLYVDNLGVQRSYGGRHYHCYNSPVFRDFTEKICLEMSRRFGRNPYVLGFQVDNEMGQEHSDRCQCPVCRRKFKEAMKEKFHGDIGALNEAFGSLFWGQRFDGFEQVEPPAAGSREDAKSNLGWRGTNMPALRLEFERFASDSLVDYFRLQRDALRRFSDKPVTHNTTHLGTNAIDYFKLARYEDVAAVDHYPYALDETKAGSASVYAMARSYKQRDFWLLETLCGGGHGNWAYQGMPMGTPGTFRQNMAFAYASGAELITAFKYSVFPSGFENLGSALIDLNRIPGRRYEEFCQAGQDLAACEPILNRTKVVSEVAVVLDYNSLWANRIKPIHKEFTYEGYAQQLVGQLAALGVNVDLIGADHPLDGYRLVLVPFAPILPEDFHRKCRDYAEKGGHLLAMTMAFSRDEWGSGIFEKSPVGMTDFFGMHVVEMEPVFDGQTDAPVRIGELTIRSHFWQETLESEGAEVLGVFRGTYRDGWPVLTEHPYGKGSALYLGTAPAPEDAPALLRWLLERCGVSLPPVEMAYGLSVVTRFSETERYIFVFNSLPREQVCRLTRSLEADYGIGELAGQTLRLPAKGFQILHERREG